MSSVNLPGKPGNASPAPPPFNEFKYYASLVFAYQQKKDLLIVAADLQRGENFFNNSLIKHNEELKRMGFPPRELIFIKDSYEVDCKIFYRLTAFLKPLLLNKRKRFTKIEKAAQMEQLGAEMPEPKSDEGKDGPTDGNENLTGGTGTTPPDPKGPPVTANAITQADEEQNFN